MILEDPACQRRLGAYAKEIRSQEAFFSWIDIQEYRGIPTPDYRRSKLMHIFRKYVKREATLSLSFLTDADVAHVSERIEAAKKDRNAIDKDTLNALQHKIFLEMYTTAYLPFKKTPSYTEMKDLIKTTHNKVSVEDFDLYELLGEGGFAKVVRVRKKTTGKFYALKIQRKKVRRASSSFSLSLLAGLPDVIPFLF